MLTIVIIAVIVIAAVVFFLVVGRGRIQAGGGRGLKQRFGPEYDRAVADHDGDTKAAERELRERVTQHASLDEQPLSPEVRAQYRAQWADVQEQFVDSPQKAVTAADALLAGLARDRGFPDGERFEEQLAALSVHHAAHVHGYRSMHTAARGQSGTEEMREVMLEARSLFEELVTEQPADSNSDRHHPQSPDGNGHAPWALNRRHTKGSNT